jgi:hypothetical protein
MSPLAVEILAWFRKEFVEHHDDCRKGIWDVEDQFSNRKYSPEVRAALDELVNANKLLHEYVGQDGDDDRWTACGIKSLQVVWEDE